MPVPTFHELMLPLLNHASQRVGETYIGGLEQEIAEALSHTDEDTSRLLPSGKQTVYSNRLNWAKSYMSKAGLVQSTRHGYFLVTQRGLDLLAERP